MSRTQSNISTLSPRAYTLVELIVVIAILVILSTVGFVGYSQYSITSRDGARASDLKALYEGLKIVQAQKGKAPAPDEALTINNGSGSLHALQGVVGESVRTAMNLESGGRDPQSGKPYTYYLFRDKKHFQLLGMFEQDGFQEKFAWDSPLTPTAYAETADLTPVTIGIKLWVVLDTDTETPINEVLTGSTTLASLAASGATVVGSPIAGTGSSVVMTPSMVVALSSPLTTSGTGVVAAAPVVSLAEQLFGASSTYTTGWTSNACDPNAMTVVEVNPGNFSTIQGTQLAGWVIPQNTVFNFANGTYTFAGTLYITRCSGLIGESETGTIFSFSNNSGFLIGIADGPYWNYSPTFSIISKLTLNQNGGNWPWYYIQAPGINNTLNNISFNGASSTTMAIYNSGQNNPNILKDITLNGIYTAGTYAWY
jgi:prepilin-type N-terminal cleavage/methylation domain-containing protein